VKSITTEKRNHRRNRWPVLAGSVLALCMLCLFVTSCGYQLRGTRHLSEDMSVIYISTEEPASLLIRYLRQQLQASGAQVTRDRKQAISVLEILQDREERRVLSVGSTGKVREFELHYMVAYRLLDAAGKEILPRRELELNRAILFDETAVLGKTNEATLVRRELQQDIVGMIMRQLEAASS